MHSSHHTYSCVRAPEGNSSCVNYSVLLQSLVYHLHTTSKVSTWIFLIQLQLLQALASMLCVYASR